MPLEVRDRCCCGLMHVRTGTWILIVIQLIIALYGIVSQAWWLRTWHVRDTEARQWLTLVISVVFLASIAMAIYALLKTLPKFMLLHMIMGLVYICWLVTNLVWSIINMVHYDFPVSEIVWQSVVWAVIILLLLYLLYVEYCAYKWLGGEATV